MNKYLLSIITVILYVVNSHLVKAQSISKQHHLIEIGTVDSLYSNTLEEKRKFWVHLPQNYSPTGTLRFPVVYVLDGGDQLKALETIYSYYNGHYVPDMILIGIANDIHRTRDLTTSEVKLRHGYAVTEASGGAENFIQFIKNELIPHIDKKYLTTPYRTLIGHSYAGLFTINTLLNHIDLFENYIAIDPSLEWDHQKLLEEAKVKLQKNNFKGKSLFVSLSAASLHMQNEEITMKNVMQDTTEYTLFARSIIAFSEFAKGQKQNELNFAWKYYPNDLHGTVPLPTIRDGLTFLFKWYQLESFWKFNNPDTPKDELVQLVRNREKKLKSHFDYFVPPFEENMLNMLGYMNLEWGKPQKSLAFFQLNAEYFPNSANAYDSLADYYNSQNDFINALKYISKAYKISGSEYHKKRIEEFKNKIN